MKKFVYISVLFFVFLTKIHAQTEIVSTGSGAAYDIAYPAAFSYSVGITLVFKAHAASLANATLNVNSLGAKTIKKYVISNLAAGDIVLNQYVTLIYDGTDWQMTSP